MDQRVAKLSILGVDPEVAEELVKAGIDTPRKIKKAKASELKNAKADKDSRVKAWRQK